jgi:hypothetical protein
MLVIPSDAKDLTRAIVVCAALRIVRTPSVRSFAVSAAQDDTAGVRHER